MKIVIGHSPADAASIAAQQIAAILERAQDAIVGLATGSSPQPLYAALASLVDSGYADFRRTRGFALDEYVGIDVEHPESYHRIIARDVIGPLRMDPALVEVPTGTGCLDDVDTAAAAYEEAIRTAGGVDVQILGIGANGHIGFNEPGSAVDSVTRRVNLTCETIAANSRFFASIDDVPTQAVSQGLGTILSAKSIVLVANGTTKAVAVKNALEGPIGVQCPASFLRNHPNVTVYLDTAAASQLSARIREESAARVLHRSEWRM